MTDTFTFTELDIEDLLNNHAYEIAELLEKTYEDIDKELREVEVNEKQ